MSEEPLPALPPINTPFRYALLHHTNHGAAHYDLMIEIPSQKELLTWRLSELPGLIPPPVIARIKDHRAVYLTYEGPISGDRGEVARIAAGMGTLVGRTAGAIEIELPLGEGISLSLPL